MPYFTGTNLRALEERADPDASNAKLLDVVQLGNDARQITLQESVSCGILQDYRSAANRGHLHSRRRNSPDRSGRRQLQPIINSSVFALIEYRLRLTLFPPLVLNHGERYDDGSLVETDRKLGMQARQTIRGTTEEFISLCKLCHYAKQANSQEFRRFANSAQDRKHSSARSHGFYITALLPPHPVHLRRLGVRQ